MEKRPTVSVLIPHYNDLDRLDLCLKSLACQTYPRDDFEIIVSDNASPQGLEAVSDVLASRARLILTQEKGAGPARNGAVSVAVGDIFAFIDSDCVADPHWLEEGVAGLRTYDFIGGRVDVLVREPQAVTAEEAYELVFAFNFKDYIEKKKFTGTGNLFCSRSVFDKVGGFKVGISEDVEWSHRAINLGFRLGYWPKAIIGHPARRDWRELVSKNSKINEEMFRLFMTRPFGRARWMARSLLLPLSALAFTPKVATSKKLRGISQRTRALRALYAIRLWRFADALRLGLSVKGS